MNSAILVVGGGITESGKVNEWMRRRLNKAVDFYIQHKQPIITLSRGTPYKPPPYDSKGFPIDEAFANAKYLSDKGVHRQDIFIESFSLDTIGNAFFARLIFIDPMMIDRLTIITSNFHMERTKMIFEWIFSLDAQKSYSLQFITVSDKGIDNDVIKERAKKEKASIEKLKTTIQSINSFSILHKWIFTTHKAYAVVRGVDTINSDISKSY